MIPAPVEPQDGPTQSRARASAQRGRDGVASIVSSTPIAAMMDALMRKLPVSETGRVWMPLGDATQLSGLPRWYLEQAIAEGRLQAHDISRPGSQKRRWRVRRADLESLPPSDAVTAATESIRVAG